MMLRQSLAALLCVSAIAAGCCSAFAAPVNNRVTVAPGETLWRIANKVRPDNDVAVVQVIYALWHANPQVFQTPSLHQLTSGSQLQIPTRNAMLLTSVTQARQWYYQALEHPPVATAQLQPVDRKQQAFTAAAPPAQTRPAQPAMQTAATDYQPQLNTTTPWYDAVQADHTLELQQRFYTQPGVQGQKQLYSSIAFSSEWYWQSDDRAHQLVLEPYLRWDQRDKERNLIDLRQAYWQYAGDGYDVKAGVDIVFWGVTESQHLVDVINQTDLVASVDAETKLGQPMLNWNLYGEGGTFSLYLLPYFRERTQAGADGRLRPLLPANNDISVYESAQKDNNLDFALRYSHRFDALDLGLSYFEGNSREPLLVPTSGSQLQPVYLQMQQLGLDALFISGSWIWKLESIYRKTRQQDFVAATTGFEYTQVGLFDTSWDLGWIVEYQYDSHGRTAPQSGQNDVFIGGRFAANDAAGSEILLGLVQDLDHSKSKSGKIEASMRLSNSLRLRFDAWLFQSQLPTEPLYSIRRDDYLQLSLDYYF